MNIPDNENTSGRLFCYSLPGGFREWCREQQIQAHLFEHFDGGGPTGFSIKFADSVAKARATEKFSGWQNTYYPSDGVLDLGTL